jgi:hypothetical protein
MPTSSTTITDQATGNEVATYTLSEDSATKHFQRVRIDHRLSSPPRRFSIGLGPAGGITAITAANDVFAGIMAVTSTVYIKMIELLQYNTVAGTNIPILVRRGTSLAAGTLVTPANIGEHWTAGAAPDAALRHGAGVTATVGTNEAMMYLMGQGTLGAINAAGVSSRWVADTIDDAIVLLPAEALVFETGAASDTDNRYFINLSWEEAT